MSTVYRVLAYLVALGVVAQAMFIAWGTFTLSHTANSAGGIVTAGDLEPEHSTAFGLHSVNSIVVSVLALALFVVSFFAKTVHHRIRWALALFLTVVVQGELGYAGYDLPALGLLHGLGALAVFTLALRSARLPAGTAENATVEAPAATAAN
jgi:hypothetical protein